MGNERGGTPRMSLWQFYEGAQTPGLLWFVPNPWSHLACRQVGCSRVLRRVALGLFHQHVLNDRGIGRVELLFSRLKGTSSSVELKVIQMDPAVTPHSNTVVHSVSLARLPGAFKWRWFSPTRHQGSPDWATWREAEQGEWGRSTHCRVYIASFSYRISNVAFLFGPFNFCTFSVVFPRWDEVVVISFNF